MHAKYWYITALLLVLTIGTSLAQTAGKVGVNTETPRATLDVATQTSPSSANEVGIILPSYTSSIADGNACSNEGQMLYFNSATPALKGMYACINLQWRMVAPLQTVQTMVSNAIPIGTIVAYDSASVPSGSDWGVCNGTANGGCTTTPNLQGMFLRSTGTQTYSGVTYTGPGIGSIMPDALGAHTHSATAPTITVAPHTHPANVTITGGGQSFVSADCNGPYDTSGNGGSGCNGGGVSVDIGSASPTATATAPTIGSTGATETRPVSYGVNFIIKCK